MKFRVGTFWHDGRDGHMKGATAYTRWYSPSWDGCKEYDIEAESGREAVKIAIARRTQEESAE